MFSLNNIARVGREAVEHVQSAAEAVNRTVTRVHDATQRAAQQFRHEPQVESAARVALHRVAEIVGAASEDAEALTTPPARIPSSCLPDDEGARLARRFAPVFHLHPDERYGLGDPDAFIENSTLRQHRSWWGDKELLGRGEVDPAALPGIEDSDDKLSLDHLDDESARAGDNATAPINYQYDADRGELTYWTFYNYNNKDYVGPLTQEHEGDWERVTVRLNEEMRPEEVLYSNHDSSPRRLDWAEAVGADGRLDLYVARGSHANSPEHENYRVEVDDGLDFRVPAGRGPGAPVDFAPDTDDEFARGGETVDARGRLLDVTEQPWFGTVVDWGSRGAKDYTSGPEGPSADKAGL